MPVCSKNRGNIIFCKPAVRCIMYIVYYNDLMFKLRHNDIIH